MIIPLSNTSLAVRYMGMLAYEKSEALQKELHDKRVAEQIPDTLLLLEHPPVITLGTRGSYNDILADTDTLATHHVHIAKTSRGGQVTLHTPGQLVGYFICNLYRKQRAIRSFIHTIEDILIETMNAFDICAHHGTTDRGVWVCDKKIASIGISVSHGVTQHGFAINVFNDIRSFSWIVPCGMRNASITTMRAETDKALSMTAICDIILDTLITKKGYSDIIKDTHTAPEW